MPNKSFLIHYGSTTNPTEGFLEKCRKEPTVNFEITGTKCDIYLIVTEQEVRCGQFGLPYFIDTREDSSTMTLIVNPHDPTAPWKRAYWLPKALREEIIEYLDAKEAE